MATVLPIVAKVRARFGRHSVVEVCEVLVVGIYIAVDPRVAFGGWR
jgi:hypothetical protein